ncbi:hypothetical protein CTA1_11076 [Colletotrichum tanaceti]|uniref:Uncharacterized protein n=1 Tax=Colletotrichum tanaceti TaxID=1306861 RepID=A0A4U6XQN8_9PEZI|nr:hypothetical protein CTA1_11076 [Colletotrichum tanaceti]
MATNAPTTANGQAPTSVVTGPTVDTIAAAPINAVEDGDDDGFTDTGSVTTSSTASLTESVTEYRRLHGRTYTQKTDYWGPNDEKQNEGLDLNHYWQTLFLENKLFLAPIGNKSHKVLDLGTGTGIWAMDFADEFPSADVMGVDISPIQPSWTPPNCKFQIDDIEKPWTWPVDFFDFIHVRNLEGCVSNWPGMYEQAFEHLQPGGWFEIKEFDFQLRSQKFGDSLGKDHIYNRWADVIFPALEHLGKTGKQTRNHGIADALGAAGFIDIVEKSWPVPVGPWPMDPVLREVGICNLEYADQSLEGFGTFLLKEIMGWEYAEILVFMSEARKAMRDATLQPYYKLHVVYARKPEASEETEEQAGTAAEADS